MAEIFLAVDDTNAGQRFVTIKRIKSDFDRDDESGQCCMTEGRIGVRCADPNLRGAYGMGEVGGSYFLAMEYSHGHARLDVGRAAALSRRALSVGSGRRDRAAART